MVNNLLFFIFFSFYFILFFFFLGTKPLPFGSGSFYSLYIQKGPEKPPRPVRRDEDVPVFTEDDYQRLRSKFERDSPGPKPDKRPPWPKYTFRVSKPFYEKRSHGLWRLGEMAFVQYMALEHMPNATHLGSSLHCGPGQRSWGGFSSDVIDFSGLTGGKLHFVNFHEAGVHYQGHCRVKWGSRDPCQREGAELTWESSTERKDMRRLMYTEFMNEAVKELGRGTEYEYSVVTECQLLHSYSPDPNDTWMKYTAVPSQFHAYMRERYDSDYLWTAPPVLTWDQMLGVMLSSHVDELSQGDRIFPEKPWSSPGPSFERISGFAVFNGGFEERHDRVSNLMGFCFQKTYPDPEELGPVALAQAGCSMEELKARCRATPQTAPRLDYDPRELEIQATTLLGWQCHARRLRGFKVRHALLYPTRTYVAPFLIKLLQMRWLIKRGDQAGLAEMLDRTSDGEELDGALLSLSLKLIINSFYGYSALRTDRFPQTKVVTDTQLCQQNNYKRALQRDGTQPVPPEDAYYFTSTGIGHCPKCDSTHSYLSGGTGDWEDKAVPAPVLEQLDQEGCPVCQEKPDRVCGVTLGKTPQKQLSPPLALTLLGHRMVRGGSKRMAHIRGTYLLTQSKAKPSLRNVAAVASMILGHSKVGYFDKLLALLEGMSASKMEAKYLDTDSVYMEMVHANFLDNCTDQERRRRLEERLPKILADPESNLSQHGKFGLESTHQCGHFRGVKVKFLYNLDGDDRSRLVTLKGIPRPIHSKVTRDHFLHVDELARWESCEDLCSAVWTCREDADAVETVLEASEAEAKEALAGVAPPRFTAQYVRIRGRKSLEVCLATDKRTIGSGINLKRRMTVSFFRIKNEIQVGDVSVVCCCHFRIPFTRCQ